MRHVSSGHVIHHHLFVLACKVDVCHRRHVRPGVVAHHCLGIEAVVRLVVGCERFVLANARKVRPVATVGGSLLDAEAWLVGS